ncbi:hypothetical protein [Pseudomonas sp. DWP3-1-2]|uniref:hypothetical protein n=1 Tax=Pseudomonas sp. DWP3-1-2 TaxID=2804645 RepID=UPI003CF1B7B3
MLISALLQRCKRLSMAQMSLQTVGLALCGLLITGCNPGLIKMSSPAEFDITKSMDAKKQKVLQNTKVDSGYLSVDAMYMEPGHRDLPEVLKTQPGKALTTMCLSGLKYDDKELSSVVSLKIGANGAIDDKSIPVSGFTLRRSGSACDIAGEHKQVTNEYPVEATVVQIHYGLRSSSGAEVPIKDIQDAIRVIGPAVSPGTFVYRIATDTVLQSVGEAANGNLKSRLKSELTESKSITAYPFSKSQAFFIPLQFQRGEENTLVGFIRIQTSLNPSVFTSSITNGFPDYSNKSVKGLLSQNISTSFTLTHFVSNEKFNITSNQNMSAISLNQSCETISTALADSFALTRSDRAFILDKILNTHPKYNKPLPDRSKPDSERLGILKELKVFTDLDCLSTYRDVLDEPAYGLNNKLNEYNVEIELITRDIISNQNNFKNSTYLLNELATALNSTDRVYAARILGSNFLDATSEITIENSVVDRELYSAGVAPIANMSSSRAADILISRLSPGRVGCFIGLSNQQLRESLYASGFQAYALYNSQDQSIGEKGWMRILITHYQHQADSKPFVKRLNFSRPDRNEHSFLIENAGAEGVSSESCQKLLQEYKTQTT